MSITKQIAEAAARLRKSDATNALQQERMEAAAAALRAKEPAVEPETTEPQMEKLDDGVYQDDSGQLFHVKGGEIFPDSISNQNFELEQGPASRVDPPQQLEQQQQETFIGRQGINRTLDETRLNQLAQDELRFINSGQDQKVAEEIYDQTGIIFGEDGQPRLELSDKRADWDLDLVEARFNQAERDGQTYTGLYVEDLFSHPALFDAVPELRNTQVNLVPSPGGKIQAFYSPRDDSINLSFDGDNPELFQRVFLHELQHAIQEKEGLAFGTSPESIFQSNFASMVTTGEVGNRVDALNAMQAISMFKSKDRNSSIPSFPEAISTIANKLRQTDDPAEKARLRQMAIRIRELNEYSNRTYARNLGEVESRDVESRFDTPTGLQDRPATMNRELADVDSRELANALDARDSRDVVRSVAGNRTPDGVAASKPIDRRNPRKIPWELEDGIHYDLKGVPFKVRNKRIVKMADDEMEEAIDNRPVTQQELDDSQVFQRMRERARDEAFERARIARDGIDRQDPEFIALQEANLQRIKTANFEAKEKRIRAEEDARVKQASKRMRAAERKNSPSAKAEKAAKDKAKPRQKPVRTENQEPVEDLAVTADKLQDKAQAFLASNNAPDITKFDSTQAAEAIREWQEGLLETLDPATADIKAIELALNNLAEAYVERFGQASFERNFSDAN